MSYKVKISSKAIKALKKIPQADKKKLVKKIDSLGKAPRPEGCKKLKGENDLYRVRSGSYRIIYEINDGVLTVIVLTIGHRKDIYR